MVFAATPASGILCGGSSSSTAPELEWEAAHEELGELQRCGLRVTIDKRPQEQAAGRYQPCVGRAGAEAEPSPSLAFVATPASFVPFDEKASASAELLELEVCGLRVRRS